MNGIAGPSAQAVSVPGAALALGLGGTKTFELVRTGQLPSLKVGRRRLVPIWAIEQFLRSRAGAGARLARTRAVQNDEGDDSRVLR